MSLAFKYIFEWTFDISAKTEKCEHVEEKVPPIGMNKTAWNKPVPFIIAPYFVWIENEIINKLVITERHERSNTCNDEDEVGDIHVR